MKIKSLLLLLAGAFFLFNCTQKTNTIITNGPDPVESIQIQVGTEYQGSIEKYGEQTLFFDSVEGKNYIVGWNDSDEGDDSKSADIMVGVFDENETALLFYEDRGFYKPFEITSEGAKTYIKIFTYGETSGTYSITVNEVLVK